jgi:very-short-patch-repair endonuclease
MARGVPDNLRENSKALRRPLMDAEHRLWFNLRNRHLGGAKFRRQHPLGPYILDFFCPEMGIVIEADGSQHFGPEQADRDRERTEYLKTRSLRVLRFDNRQVLAETNSVLEVIFEALGVPSP